MEYFHHLSQKQTKTIIGLMSGTSMDGVDAALVEVKGHGLDTKVEVIAFETFPFNCELRLRMIDLCHPQTSRVDEICQLNFLIGEMFALAACSVVRCAQMNLSAIDLIGSHGQTICHLPPQPGGQHVPSTLQIGEPAVIANHTGIATVADFRVADVAAGGQGAPLIPYVDFLLFRQINRTIALQNIGGISNVTIIPAGCEQSGVSAADTGPGNMVIDAVVESLTSGKETCDIGGQIAGQGQPCEPLITEWLKHPFICAAPPKTTGREDFGRDFSRDIIDQARLEKLSDSDLVATATEFTARTIHDYYSRFLLPLYEIDEICVSGGGVHNLTLMRRLKELLRPIPIESIDTYGIPVDAKEAIAFAVLANEAVSGRPGNLPQSTGASRAKILGKYVPP